MDKQPWESAEAVEPGQAVPWDYWVITQGAGLAVFQNEVSAETALAVVAALDQTPAPEWITYRNLGGNRVRMRTSCVVAVHESTAANRAHTRAFERALKAEKDWGED